MMGAFHVGAFQEISLKLLDCSGRGLPKHWSNWNLYFFLIINILSIDPGWATYEAKTFSIGVLHR
jgi:hypothetical protein